MDVYFRYSFFLLVANRGKTSSGDTHRSFFCDSNRSMQLGHNITKNCFATEATIFL